MQTTSGEVKYIMVIMCTLSILLSHQNKRQPQKYDVNYFSQKFEELAKNSKRFILFI